MNCKRAGGVRIRCDHRRIIEPVPQTDRAIEMIKAFIARQLQPVG